MRRIIACAVSALLLSPSLAAELAAPVRACFSARDFESWKAPDAKTIYVRVRMNSYYRLDLAGACPAVRSPGSHLITVFRGSDLICTPLDWDLKVSEGLGGIATPCLVKAMTRLTPDEVRAIPPKFKP
jgi:hypothetical protein